MAIWNGVATIHAYMLLSDMLEKKISLFFEVNQILSISVLINSYEYFRVFLHHFICRPKTENFVFHMCEFDLFAFTI